MRDPKLNPLPGESFRKGIEERHVEEIDAIGAGFHVVYRNASGRVRRCWCQTWRDWARGAEVVTGDKS